MKFEVGDLIETDPNAHDWDCRGANGMEYMIVCEHSFWLEDSIDGPKRCYIIFNIANFELQARDVDYIEEYWRKVI